MKTPDITPAQITAKLTFIAGELVAWGLVSNTTAQLVVSVAAPLVAIALMFADAHIRNGRATGSRAAAANELATKLDPLIAQLAKPAG